MNSLFGQQFEKLLVIDGPVKVSNGKCAMQTAYLCRCDCGKESVIPAYKLKVGRSKSCGCQVAIAVSAYMRENPKKPRHGHSHSPTYRSWYAMLQRCTNANNKRFDCYGGRGITVCDRWRLFDNFLADMGERPIERTIDRINVNGNYEVANCRWATSKEQAANRRKPESKRNLKFLEN